jgi:hypothetical protein
MKRVLQGAMPEHIVIPGSIHVGLFTTEWQG